MTLSETCWQGKILRAEEKYWKETSGACCIDWRPFRSAAVPLFFPCKWPPNRSRGKMLDWRLTTLKKKKKVLKLQYFRKTWGRKKNSSKKIWPLLNVHRIFSPALHELICNPTCLFRLHLNRLPKPTWTFSTEHSGAGADFVTSRQQRRRESHSNWELFCAEALYAPAWVLSRLPGFLPRFKTQTSSICGP